MQTLEELLRERLDGIDVSDIAKASSEQRHLNQDSDERSYWHHGYRAALSDVIKLIANASGDLN